MCVCTLLYVQQSSVCVCVCVSLEFGSSCYIVSCRTPCGKLMICCISVGNNKAVRQIHSGVFMRLSHWFSQFYLQFSIPAPPQSVPLWNWESVAHGLGGTPELFIFTLKLNHLYIYQLNRRLDLIWQTYDQCQILTGVWQGDTGPVCLLISTMLFIFMLNKYPQRRRSERKVEQKGKHFNFSYITTGISLKTRPLFYLHTLQDKREWE